MNIITSISGNVRTRWAVPDSFTGEFFLIGVDRLPANQRPSVTVSEVSETLLVHFHGWDLAIMDGDEPGKRKAIRAMIEYGESLKDHVIEDEDDVNAIVEGYDPNEGEDDV